MSGSDLSAADLYGADLSGVDLSNSITAHTIFADVDLSAVIGLETVRHHCPSSIDIDTLYKSKGNIPEVFLRGCGVPDLMIKYAKSLTNIPIQYYSCFISYSHKDEEFVQRLHADLQANNVRCWYAPHDLPIGAKTKPTIDEAIRVNDKLPLILTQNSVQSNWLENEAEHALDFEPNVRGLYCFLFAWIML